MDNFINSPLLYNLALTLIHFLWQGCLIALVLKLLLIITPYTQSLLRYTWATIAMVASFVTPIVTYALIYQPDFTHIASQSTDVATMISSQNLASNENILWYLEIFDTLPYLSMAWMAVVVLLASKLAIELYSVNQLPKVGTVLPDEQLAQRFSELTSRIGLKKAPRLFISLKADIPMAIGWLRPVILIPASMISGLAPAQLDMLLLHELAHIRRHDYLVNFIQTLVETLLFFHPSVRWISKQMRNEREYCSDDIAVQINGNPIAYAHTLADTAAICTKHRSHAIPNMAMAASGGDLKQRVVRLVDQHHCSSNDDSGKFLASVLIIFSIITVAIKPYLNSNIIDFTSGRISLFKTANDFIQKKPANAVDLPSTSIAQLLLSKNDATVADVKPVESKQISKATDKVSAITSQQLSSDQHQRNNTANKEIAVNDATERSDSVVKTGKVTSKQDVKSAPITPFNTQSEETLVVSKTEALLSNKPQASISEQAFERTDSKRNNSQTANPYSERIASLALTPSYENLDKTFTKTTLKTEFIAKKRQPKIKPVYTITREEKPRTIKPAMIKRAAEILVSADPRYPSTAKRKGIEIDVKVAFTIDINGNVKDIEFQSKSKVSYFRSSIRTALSKWRFLPAQVNNKPVESKMSKIFSFSLMK